MKILELSNFSAGGCGVWARAREEAMLLSKKGHTVRVYSSFFEKGSNKVLPLSDSIGEVKITRFPARFLGGESFMNWSFEKEALEYAPDIIITHNYRQLNTTKALKIASELKRHGKNCNVFLVTHAPFVEGNITRSLFAKFAVKFYDSFIGPATINKFDKILPISKWEIPFLKNLGAEEKRIVYIPNGIPKEFFDQKKSKELNQILFLGRISPKKKIETLISAIPLIDDKKIVVELVGPKEEEYFEKIKFLISKLALEKMVRVSPPVYNIKEKIKKIDSCKVFILPSRVEGMPQSLIEAMARGKIVIGSDSIAIRDLIKNKGNGFLFEFDSPENLALTVNEISRMDKKSLQKIKKESKVYAQQFSWDKVIERLERVLIETNKS